MSSTPIFRNWWVLLIQGILMIILSILIFKNPGAVLASMAFWLGIIITASGLYGVVSYFGTDKNERDLIFLLGSIAMTIIGFMMMSKMIIGMTAISIAFGAIVSTIGLVLISGSWQGRNLIAMWWLIALLGIAVLITGVKSMMDVGSGADSISSLLGISILLSGIGLIGFALLKKNIVNTVKA